MTLENLMNLNEPIFNTCHTDLFNFAFKYYSEILFNDNENDNNNNININFYYNNLKFEGDINELINLRKLILDLNNEKNEMFLLK